MHILPFKIYRWYSNANEKNNAKRALASSFQRASTPNSFEIASLRLPWINWVLLFILNTVSMVALTRGLGHGAFSNSHVANILCRTYIDVVLFIYKMSYKNTVSSPITCLGSIQSWIFAYLELRNQKSEKFLTLSTESPRGLTPGDYRFMNLQGFLETPRECIWGSDVTGNWLDVSDMSGEHTSARQRHRAHFAWWLSINTQRERKECLTV